jgi:hypothetical protein
MEHNGNIQPFDIWPKFGEEKAVARWVDSKQKLRIILTKRDDGMFSIHEERFIEESSDYGDYSYWCPQERGRSFFDSEDTAISEIHGCYPWTVDIKSEFLESIDPKFTLHRYFIWANRMRTHFDEELKKVEPNRDFGEYIEANMYMSLWYSQLYVVVEGWRELGLQDTNIDELLKSPNIELLRRYRNGVCHFQKDYFDDRFQEFISEGEKVVEWVRELNREFGRWFLEYLKAHKK